MVKKFSGYDWLVNFIMKASSLVLWPIGIFYTSCIISYPMMLYYNHTPYGHPIAELSHLGDYNPESYM